MKKALAFALMLLMWGPATAEARELQPEILGVRLGMAQKEARVRLARLGKLEREERKRQEVWQVRDRRYTHLLVGFDAQGRVRYVTAVARPRGKPVRYTEVGDPKAAKVAEVPGHKTYTWEVGGEGGPDRYVVMARGSDPQFLSTWSVKRPH